MKASCVVCGKGFEKRGKAKTCGPVCSKKRNVERNAGYRAVNPEKSREANRANIARYRAEHPGKAREYAARRYAAHPEKAREANVKWRAANPEKVRERQRKYRAENREKALEAPLMPDATLSDRLRIARKKAGLTQVQAAEKYGIDKSFIGLIETGRRSPNLESLIKLAAIYGCDAADLDPRLERRKRRKG